MTLPSHLKECVICKQLIIVDQTSEEPIQDRHKDLVECVRALGFAVERLEYPNDD